MVAERVAWRPSLRRRGARGLSHRSGVNGRARVACRPSLRRRRAGTRPAARCAAGSRAPNPKGVWKAERTAEPKRLLDCARAFVGFAVGVRRPCLACFGTLSAPSFARPATGRVQCGCPTARGSRDGARAWFARERPPNACRGHRGHAALASGFDAVAKGSEGQRRAPRRGRPCHRGGRPWDRRSAPDSQN